MYSIFEKLLNEKGIKVADVCRATGIRQGVFSDWKAGRYTPKADKLNAIAHYLGVSYEYLTTGKENKEDAWELSASSHMLMVAMLKLIGKQVDQDENGNLTIVDDGIEYVFTIDTFDVFCKQILDIIGSRFDSYKGSADSIKIQFKENDPRRGMIAHMLTSGTMPVAAHEDQDGTEKDKNESLKLMKDDEEWR